MPLILMKTKHTPLSIVSPRRQTSGFTLTELLVVIAIIGVLVGIVIPVVSHTVSQTNLVRCSSNIRQVAMSMLGYASDHWGRLPSARLDTSWSRALINGGYLTDTQTLVCPADDYAQKALRPRSYAYASPAMLPRYDPNRAAEITSFHNPARTFMLSEWHTDQQDYNSYSASVVGASTAIDPSFVQHPDGRRNYAFIDGHVQTLGMGDFVLNDPRWGIWNEQSGVQDH
jgi:prepilin-type N-terminal cleavage/methylation domain-containing protein/prepilin-type processing-associated H-X9-DG protein